MHLGAIADDFTGATDLASILARSGHPVSLRIGVPAGPPVDASPYEVIALKIRTSTVAQATAEALAALEWLQAAGAERCFWKYCSTFDSTPAGNIGPVAEALMERLGVAQTIHCPAFPENGRTVYMGRLFVGDTPLDESPMKDHPLTPMRDSSLLRLLEPQVTAPVALIDWPTVARGADAIAGALGELSARGVAHVVIDAITDEDLRQIATACRNMALLNGGSGLAMPLPGLSAAQPTAPTRSIPAPPGLTGHTAAAAPVATAGAGTARPRPAPEAVILSGSVSQMSNAQVDAYCATGAPAFRLDPRALAAAGGSGALRWLRDQDLRRAPLVYSTADPESVRSVQHALGGARAAALVEDALAECAKAAVAAGARRIVVAGGETAGAVTEALGVARLDIGPEIAPGVPWCYFTRGSDTHAIALKSGNFGTETFFSEALAVLDHPAPTSPQPPSPPSVST